MREGGAVHNYLCLGVVHIHTYIPTGGWTNGVTENKAGGLLCCDYVCRTTM